MLNRTIRDERESDLEGIRAVNRLAFPGGPEAAIVDDLREHGALTLSLVAEMHGLIVGHIAFSPVTIDAETGTFEAMGLGPMAVHPEFQGQKTGSLLAFEGLARLTDLGHGACVVVGHPEYYQRFGFRPASDFGLVWRDDVPAKFFMAIELEEGWLSAKAGRVLYRPELESPPT